MKIRTIRPHGCCAGFYCGRKREIRIGDCDAHQCNISKQEYREKIEQEKHSCLIDRIEIGDMLFVRVYSYEEVPESGGTMDFVYKTHSDFIVEVLQHEDGNCVTLSILSNFGRTHNNFTTNSYVWVESLIPECDYSQIGHKAIFTSDGVVFLEDGNFLGAKDGSIAEFTPKEMLDSISKERTQHSSAVEQLRLTPVTNRPRSPRRGTIIFNNTSRRIEFYDGTGWKTI